MSSAGAQTAPPAGRRPPNGNSSTNYKFDDCKEIESAVRLTPPALIDKLCKGELLPPVSGDAIFIEELIEIVQKLNRMHLVIIDKSDP